MRHPCTSAPSRSSSVGSVPPTAGSLPLLNRLAGVQVSRGDPSESEDLFRRAVAVADAAADCDPSERMLALNNLAFLYRQRGEVDEAKHLFVRALAALEATVGPGDPLMVTVLRNLALLSEETGDRSQAKALSKRARAIEATISRTQVSP